jgi:hypothetical protein
MEKITSTPTSPAVAQAFKEILTDLGFEQNGHLWRLNDVTARIGQYQANPPYLPSTSYRALFARGQRESFSPFVGSRYVKARLPFGRRRWLKGEIRRALRQLHDNFEPYSNVENNSCLTHAS